MRAASENILTPENDSKTSPVYEGSSTANVQVENQLKREPLLDAASKELGVGRNVQNDEPGDIRCTAEKIVQPAVEKDLEGQVGCKDDKATSDSAGCGSETKENPHVGKVKIKPMASLVETNKPNPNPRVHPFFAGSDDHMHSLIMNRQHQFALPSQIQRPLQFTYYDHSTNMDLINGNKMAQIPFSSSSFPPYVPINVPRPPRFETSMRTCLSTQILPMFSESVDVPDVPVTSSQPKDLSGSNVTPENDLSMPNIPLPQTLIVGNEDQKPNKVSTPNTDDFESSEDKEIIKTELNLGNEPNEDLSDTFRPTEVDLESELNEELPLKFRPTELDLENELNEELPLKYRPTEVDLKNEPNEDLPVTLQPTVVDLENKSIDVPMNACNNSGTPFMDAPGGDTCQPLDPEHQLIMTGDAILTPPSRATIMNPVYVLPAYSTKGAYSCKYCDFRCNYKRKMKQHLEKMHTAENKYKCFYCIKKLSPRIYHKTLLALEHHVGKVHRGEKRWRCKGCSKTYKSQAAFKSHVEKMCYKPRPYACHKCTFTCMTEVKLEKHLKAHENSLKLHQCLFCNKSFKKYKLKRHLMTVHGPPEEKPFRCTFCNYAYGTQTAMENHYKRTHHDKQCHHCNYEAHSTQDMTQHMEVVHLKVGVNNSKNDDPSSKVTGEDVFANFGGWLGISGDITNMADNFAPAMTESRIETESQVTEMREVGDDDEYENVVPITCLVEVKDEEMYGSFVEEEEDDETLGSVKVEKFDMGDSEYLHITPEHSKIVNESFIWTNQKVLQQMTEMRAASENILAPDYHSKTSPVYECSSTAIAQIETQLKREPLLDATSKELWVGCNLQNEEPSVIECTAEKIVKPVVEEGQVGFKENKATSAGSGSETKENLHVGKVKIKPIASLVETNPDDRSRFLMMNQHPQFSLPSQIQKRYVPINVPQTPRSQESMRTSCFSSQTPPMISGSLDVSAVTGASYQCLLQSRSSSLTLNPPNDFPFLPNKLSSSNATPENNPSVPNIPMPQTLIVGNADKKPNLVSTSYSTDDLETSEDKEIIKTEVDLEFEPNEDKFRPSELDLENESIEPAVNAGYNAGTHFIDAPDVDTCEVKPENIMLTSEQPLIMTGEAFLAPPSRAAIGNPVYILPAYSTKGAYSCKCCDFRCNNMSKIKEHLEEMHTAENNYKCFYCIKNLSPRIYHKTLFDLEYHVGKVHRGEQRWQCMGCSKSYKSTVWLDVHVKVCSKLRPYACHKCPFTCMTKTALVRHFKASETSELQPCPICNKSFKNSNLWRHLRTLHGPPEQNPFLCTFCNYAYETRTDLENHYRRSHY